MDTESENDFTNVQYLTDDYDEQDNCCTGILDFEEKVILLVQAQPILFDLRENEYFNKIKKDKEWFNISISCGKTVEECKLRWKTLRDTFMREKRKTPRSGAGNLNKKPWRYMQSLEFLTPTLTKAKSVSNYQAHSPTSIDSDISQAGPRSGKQSTPEETIPNSSKRRRSTNIEEKLINLIEHEEEDSDTKFLLCLKDQLGRLTPKRKHLAKIRFQQILFDFEFNSSE